MDSLQRFLNAQEGMYPVALGELLAGKKRSHWIWYIFPQLRGLGVSENSSYYGISGQEEARAYLTHPVLGQRLIACCEAMLGHREKTARQILGKTDAQKLRSSMTLFAYISETGSVFHKVLEQFYLESADLVTVRLLERENARQPYAGQIRIPEGVTDKADWEAWVRGLYRSGKRRQEVRAACRIIRDLLKKGYTEEFLKGFRNRFEVYPQCVSVTDANDLLVLAETDYEEAF